MTSLFWVDHRQHLGLATASPRIFSGYSEMMRNTFGPLGSGDTSSQRNEGPVQGPTRTHAHICTRRFYRAPLGREFVTQLRSLRNLPFWGCVILEMSLPFLRLSALISKLKITSSTSQGVCGEGLKELWTKRLAHNRH